MIIRNMIGRDGYTSARKYQIKKFLKRYNVPLKEKKILFKCFLEIEQLLCLAKKTNIINNKAYLSNKFVCHRIAIVNNLENSTIAFSSVFNSPNFEKWRNIYFTIERLRE